MAARATQVAAAFHGGEQLGAGSEAPDLSTLEQGQTDLQETLTSLSDQLSQTQDNLAALSV